MGPERRASCAGRLGKLLCRHEPEKALPWLRLALAERPTEATTWASLAEAALRCGHREEARQAVLAGVASDRLQSAWPNLMQQLGLTEAYLLPDRKPETAKRHRQDARDLLKMGHRDQAMARFRLALHHDPDDIDSAWGVAAAWSEGLRSGEMKEDPDDHELARLLEQVAFGNPTWPWSWATLVEVLERRGEHERALLAVEAYLVYAKTTITASLETRTLLLFCF